MYKNWTTPEQSNTLVNVDLKKMMAEFECTEYGKCKLEFVENDAGALHPYMVITEKNEHIEYYETDIYFLNLFDVIHEMIVYNIK